MVQSIAITLTSCHSSQLKIFLIFYTVFIPLDCVSQLVSLSNQQAHHGGQQPLPSSRTPPSARDGHDHHHHYQMQEQPAPTVPDSYQRIQILIPNLAPDHYQFWLKNHPRAAKVFEEVCARAGSRPLDIQDLGLFQQLHSNLSFEQPRYLQDLNYGKWVLSLICSKIKDVSKSCWGYENNCQEILLMPECHGTSYGQASSEQEQKIKWFSQADFGYIYERRKEMSRFCAPERGANLNEVSSFECTKHFATCRGHNLFVNFNGPNSDRTAAELGGRGCDLQTLRIKEESGHSGKYQSWYNELANYSLVKPEEASELVVNEQVFFVKFDPTDSLDSHLGTFVNLYATMHLNNRFSHDVKIVIWDRARPRPGSVDQLWYAFSRFPVSHVSEFGGRRVLFKKFIFAMPPKMVDGLHTDKQLIDGCTKSGLYSAFHKHVVHRLNKPQLYNLDFHLKTRGRMLRVTILSRTSSQFREILNENELESAIKRQSANVFVSVHKYKSMDFGHILLAVLHSDLVIGLHGTGLAYSLFLPDWAGLIELYDCKKSRYRDLARLRGISYHGPTDEQLNGAGTPFVKRVPVPAESELWKGYNRSQLADKDEFNNYEVNVDEFIKLYLKASQQVLKRRDEYFRKEQEDLRARATPEPMTSEPKMHDQQRAGSGSPASGASPTSTRAREFKSKETSSPPVASLSGSGGQRKDAELDRKSTPSSNKQASSFTAHNEL